MSENLESVDLTQIAIKEFINSSGDYKSTKVSLRDNEVRNNRFLKSTHIINRRNISTTTGKEIFKKEGIGVLREITVVADQKINLQMELDGRQPFGMRSDWDDLAAITLYSETVVAKLVGSDYVLNLKLLHFKQGLSIFAWFNTQATISNILGVYDLCEEY